MKHVITAGTNPVKVMYKEAGKSYNTGNGESGATADPFEEKTVGAGESFELPDGAEFIRSVEMGLGGEYNFNPSVGGNGTSD